MLQLSGMRPAKNAVMRTLRGIGINDASSANTVMPEGTTMRINIKDSQEKRLWTADYKNKSGFERSIFTPNTEEKIAKLCIKRIAAKLKDDFPAIKEATR